MTIKLAACLVIYLSCCVFPVYATEHNLTIEPEDKNEIFQINEFGSVTNLPLPRYVSIKAKEAYARRGPSTSHRIDWTFTRSGIPVEIIAEFGNWRRTRTMDGAGGWVYASLLSGARTVIFTTDNSPIRILPRDDSPLQAEANRMVIAKLGNCEINWCQVRIGNTKGWVNKKYIWGVYPDELRR